MERKEECVLEHSVASDRGLPGLNCGLCGHRTCGDFEKVLRLNPGAIERCIPLAERKERTNGGGLRATGCSGAGCRERSPEGGQNRDGGDGRGVFLDSLDRPVDFYLEHFPADPGPREIIVPHNPMITREMEIEVGDILVGRPLGMSCGCPITHCGTVIQVDRRTGVMTWCITGPLTPRMGPFKDIGYYIAEAYEGLVAESRVDIRIGMRYFFQPRMCMLQWRHSGLVNAISRRGDLLQIRLEGLFIG